MSKANDSVGRDEAKVMNRSDLTRQLVGKLTSHEAVIGGRQRPQTLEMFHAVRSRS